MLARLLRKHSKGREKTVQMNSNQTSEGETPLVSIGSSPRVPSQSKVPFTPTALPPLPSALQHSSMAVRQAWQTRNTPVQDSKYLYIWKRLKVKIRTKKLLGSLNRELQLFGSGVHHAGDQDDLLSVQIERFVNKEKECLKAEEDENTVKLPWYIIHPRSSFRSFWNILVIILLLYTATVMPFRIAFYSEDSGFWQYFDWLLDALFFTDLIVNCFSSYYSEDGQLVTSFTQIFLSYLRTWLILDLCGSLPFEVILSDSTSFAPRYNNFLRLARLPRLYRLLRIARVVKMCSSGKESEIMERIQDFLSIKHTAVRIFSFVFSVFICVHLMSCLWFFTAKIEDLAPESWVVKYNFQDNPILDQYIASMYWAFTTLCTVGYGDIHPTTYPERILAVVWMIFGVYFFSFTIGSLSAILSNIDTKETILMTKLAIIDEFVRDTHLDRSMRLRLRLALKYNSEKEGYSLSDKQGIFSELPRILRHEVSMLMHQGVVKEIPFFTERDPMFAATVVPFLQHLFVKQGNMVYKENEYADEVYFIVKGSCGIVYGMENYLVKKLQRGSYFGEIEVMEAIPRKYSIMALVNTDLLTMHKKLLATARQEFPSIYNELLIIAETRDRLNHESIIEHKEYVKIQHSEQISLMSCQDIKASVKKRASLRIGKQKPSISNSPRSATMAWPSPDLSKQIQENEVRIVALEKEIDEVFQMVSEQRVMIRGIIERRKAAARRRLKTVCFK